MPRRPSTLSQADLSRVLRSAKAAGVPKVRVCFPGGTSIEIDAAAPRPDGVKPPVLIEPGSAEDK